MHHPQLPDETGWAVYANFPFTLADDWQCTETGPVKDIHFWGGWKQGNEGTVLSFWLRIYEDISAAGSPTGYSMPGALLWEKQCFAYEVSPMNPATMEGWYWPEPGLWEWDDHQQYYQYDICFDEPDWFYQESGTIYWLNISADVDDPAFEWGWKSTQDHWNDDAVWGGFGVDDWYEIYEPPGAYDYVPGDFNGDGTVDNADWTSYELWLYNMGPPPAYEVNGFYPAADCNGDCMQTAADFAYLGAYLFSGGPAPYYCDMYPPISEAQSLDLAFVITATDAPESCCLPDTTCANLSPADCITLGGSPQGPGTVCLEGAFKRACCFPDGSCLTLDTLCCLEVGGTISPYNSCGGDYNNNGINDVCEPYWGACCMSDGTCELHYEQDCINLGGEYKGDYVFCLGDNNRDGTDDRCEDPWEPGDQHKMHFPQLPDDIGTVVGFMDPTPEVKLADDFMCMESGPITDIHFWGAFRSAVPLPFHDVIISIHSDIPAASSPTGYSMPGDTLWSYFLHYGQYNETPLQANNLTWYDPFQGLFQPLGNQTMYQYDIYIPDTQWFYQDSGTIYWLSFNLMPSMPHEWGWVSTADHWNDDAVWYFEPVTPEWQELYQPPDFVQSLDLSFVITGLEAETEACCLPGGSCLNLPPDDCTNMDGTPQGPGTSCGPVMACCLSDGACINADSLCCVNELGGVPQGLGTNCEPEEACCMPDGKCRMLTPICCIDMGGTPMGPGTQCGLALAACCLGDTCLTIDSLCCMELGGTIPPEWPWFCLGDNDLSGIDDACEAPLKGACCLPEGGCVYVNPGGCEALGGEYKGDATLCQGDNNANGVDDACDPPWQFGDEHKMHFPQLPDPEGWDVHMEEHFPIADNWQCTETGWVKDIHFWGSWRDDMEDNITEFRIFIYDDGGNMPMAPIWLYQAYNFVETPIPNELMEGWLEPWSGMYMPENHSSLIQYDVYIPEQSWFWQDSGSTYWVSIYPILEHGFGQWGWKSSTEQWSAPSVWTDIPAPPPGHMWMPISEPPSFEGFLDLSFVITGGMDCDCIPGDANGDGQINIGDAVYIISYVFKGGPAPFPYATCSGDANCDCQCNIGDAVYLISFVFSGGPPPCACDEWLGLCGPPLRK
jgi:hypothetical protein